MTLRDVCTRYGPRLTGITHDGEPVEGARLLWAIAGCETHFGERRDFVRPEKAYMPGGKYFGASHLLQEWHKWGVLASSSYGAFQVLYISAYELGFREHPIALQGDLMCAEWASTYIVRRILKAHATRTLADVFDAYNSGRAGDSSVPVDYIARGLNYYMMGWEES